jgi:hypothetical protein
MMRRTQLLAILGLTILTATLASSSAQSTREPERPAPGTRPDGDGSLDEARLRVKVLSEVVQRQQDALAKSLVELEEARRRCDALERAQSGGAAPAPDNQGSGAATRAPKAAAGEPSQMDIDRAMRRDPELAKIQANLETVKENLKKVQRLMSDPSDPSFQAARRKYERLVRQYRETYEKRLPEVREELKRPPSDPKETLGQKLDRILDELEARSRKLRQVGLSSERPSAKERRGFGGR